MMSESAREQAFDLHTEATHMLGEAITAGKAVVYDDPDFGLSESYETPSGVSIQRYSSAKEVGVVLLRVSVVEERLARSGDMLDVTIVVQFANGALTEMTEEEAHPVATKPNSGRLADKTNRTIAENSRQTVAQHIIDLLHSEF